MRKYLQINTGEGWNNLCSEFYANGDNKEEAKAQHKMEVAMSNWPFRYEPYQNAQFRIVNKIH